MGASVKDRIYAMRARHGDNSSPPSGDHVIKFSPNTDVVLAYQDGQELARLAWEVDGHLVHFKAPTLAQWPGFVKKMSALLTLLHQYSSNVEIPEDMVKEWASITGSDHGDRVYQQIMGVAITARKQVPKLCLDIFFNYLSGTIKGVGAGLKGRKFVKAQRKWFEEHIPVTDVQKVFTACLCVDQLVKKNAEFILQGNHNPAQHEPGAAFLVPRA